MTMLSSSGDSLAWIEPRLRVLLPPDLYVATWMEPSSEILMQAFEHLRTLQRILYDYLPSQVSQNPPKPGEIRYSWAEGTLLFTDLAGFTPLMEANARLGLGGAEAMLNVLNAYFTTMLDILSKSGGGLLEFTGDAIAARFSKDRQQSDVTRAIRAGLRMQRAMQKFADLDIGGRQYSLRMRVGIHTGRFLSVDIGSPLRMEHVLFGRTVQEAKQAEGSGAVGQVCLTEAAYNCVKEQFRFEPENQGHYLVVDDLSDDQLGEYDIALPRRRSASNILFDRSPEGLTSAIIDTAESIAPLACYLPLAVLRLVVEHASDRKIPPNFPEITVGFITLVGLSEAVDAAQPEELAELMTLFSKMFSLINGATEARGGILKKITYHPSGTNMMICFGVPYMYQEGARQAADAIATIRNIFHTLPPLKVGGEEIPIHYQIGLARGSVFTAEVGDPRGRREFNILSDTVNTAARLMSYASPNQVLITDTVYRKINTWFDCRNLGHISLKGKAAPVLVYELQGNH